MTLLLALLISLVTTSPPDATPASVRAFTEKVQHAYAHNEAGTLRRLLASAPTEETRLLVLYRLYPLTDDDALLNDLPHDLTTPSARSLALLSALWGYRTASAPVVKMAAYGRRAGSLIDEAKALDATDPYVLLVEGQSLLFRPRLFGGSVERALSRFDTLRRVLTNYDAPGVSTLEAELWRWYALRKLDPAAADALRDRLLKHELPPLYRQLLKGDRA